jgi:hypothetical protein
VPRETRLEKKFYCFFFDNVLLRQIVGPTIAGGGEGVEKFVKWSIIFCIVALSSYPTFQTRCYRRVPVFTFHFLP